ncbi:hypothetical protein SAMN06264364_12121 [Quadrisphaera granulorum]|uniref:Uncharacterized protein n=1 Tax=Quadrisphaera granulorum TaxID=317664 RepID=A0A316A360_9ACTN|nr:hypothetical protein [Quadrisphaera granulorum]PWJ51144.1 hypothetical protein BXY45_12121 [Quadrisphaera granulorum]SZE97794.1 hypothetical protein SAMN06264364_12121 [Quadrisphaera granulorum]
MRGIWLHARARHVPEALVALVVVVLVGAWCADALSSSPRFGGRFARPPVVVGAALAGALLVLATLAGADTSLERSAARTTARWRATHAVLAVALAVGALVLAVLPDPWHFGAVAMARNTAGFAGIALASAALLPARAAWAPVFGYGTVVYLAAPKPTIDGAGWWAWPTVSGVPADSGPAVVSALAALVVGVVLYAVRGPVPVAPEVV